MFNSAAMFFERRCSSQLDIPTLWVVPDEEDEDESSSSSNRRRRRPRHSLPLSTLVKPRRPSLVLTPATPSTALMLSPVTPNTDSSNLCTYDYTAPGSGMGFPGPDSFESTNDMISEGRECSGEYPLLNHLHSMAASHNEAKVITRTESGTDANFTGVVLVKQCWNSREK